jgi:SNF2 family DNA or RNA helicase
VLWERELDARVIDSGDFAHLGERGFDPADDFAAHMRAVRWNAVSAANKHLLQAPFRAGIKLEAYQLEPLVKALDLPRVNLFIADDVGLGKTIEAGLVMRELMLRRRCDFAVVACPPSMLMQWKDELENRFGLSFLIVDRSHLARVRREQGYSTNIWATHPRFLISHALLADETYVAGLKELLGSFRQKALLILDEAHHAAPSSGQRYAIDSQLTRAVRGLAARFEHRLFLSATPHNGHSYSFAALLEILDPNRFMRGIKVRKGDLDHVMVRRLKEDIRLILGGFPERIVQSVILDGLPSDAPELRLAEMLDRYGQLRLRRLAGLERRRRAQAQVAFVGLQKRLLSSIKAFSKTLNVHIHTLGRALAAADEVRVEALSKPHESLLEQFVEPAGSDDDDAELDEGQRQKLEELATEAATLASVADATIDQLRQELDFAREIQKVVAPVSDRADARVAKLAEWIDQNLCPGVVPRTDGSAVGPWADRRLLIFTEYEDTRRWLEASLKTLISRSPGAERRIGAFTGSTTPEAREALKNAFNAPPDKNQLRILIATDAAREGLNLQRHCADLFHFDLPWNPSRLEQRNGRIDRKLQPAAQVFCRYFVYAQRPEDRVLCTLVEKTERIRQELGSLGRVVEPKINARLSGGIKRAEVEDLIGFIERSDQDEGRTAIETELEEAKEREVRTRKLNEQLERLRRLLKRSEDEAGINRDHLRETLSTALRRDGAPALQRVHNEVGPLEEWRFPTEAERISGSKSWLPVVDMLREPRQRGEDTKQWRARANVRPLVFDDPDKLGDSVVQVHFEHRLAQRLIGRFLSRGFQDELSRACLTTGGEARPSVVLMARLALYGPGASRLHDEVVTVAAYWTEPDVRRGALQVLKTTEAQDRILDSLDKAIADARLFTVDETVRQRLHAAIPRDLEELEQPLQRRLDEGREAAESALRERGEAEAKAFVDLLLDQRRRIVREATEFDRDVRQLAFHFPEEMERAQRERDRRRWDARLQEIERQLISEPQRIRESYVIKAARVDPVGIVYLWPRTN